MSQEEREREMRIVAEFVACHSVTYLIANKKCNKYDWLGII